MRTIKFLFLLIFLIITLVNQSFSHPLNHGQIKLIKSKILGEEREIYISLPPNYERNIHKYPVIFVLDAEFLFEITHAIAKLNAARNYMPESIIVGIPNNTNKRLDMALKVKPNIKANYRPIGGKADKYLSFLKNELIPMINKNYRANPHRSIIGLSPTVGPVYQALWSEPSLFNDYIGLAADLTYFTEAGISISETIYNAAKKNKEPNTTIYLSRASNDVVIRPAIGKAYRDLDDKIRQLFNKIIRHKLEVLDQEEHYGMAVQGIKNAFKLIYPRQLWNPNFREFGKSNDPVSKIKSHYKTLTNFHGFKIIPIEGGFWSPNNLLGAGRMVADKNKKVDILELGTNYYPNSPSLYNNLAWAYFDNAQQKKAVVTSLRSVNLGQLYQAPNLSLLKSDLKELQDLTHTQHYK